MQNNTTELVKKLSRSLDNSYNVTDMHAVLEVISILEKSTITKESLEATRLGRYVNEMRRKTTDKLLAKRAKDLLRRWREMVKIPDTNGQLKQSPTPDHNILDDSRLIKKRPALDNTDILGVKRSRLNGTVTELDLSDNSNSSFKEVTATAKLVTDIIKKDVILINSDSNSSIPEGKQDPMLDQQLPKKRGRKKGSKNHKNLLDEAETSFSNKMALSRVNCKVKTTQELVASLQNKTGTGAKVKEDLNERAAKLTQRVSMIDQKLYSTNSNSFRRRKALNIKGEKIIESGYVSNVNNEETSTEQNLDDEEVIVVDEEPKLPEIKEESIKTEEIIEPPLPRSLSVEEALKLLPPIDRSCLYDDEDVLNETSCTCTLKENKGDFTVEEEEEIELPEQKYEFIEDCNCPKARQLKEKYRFGDVSDERIRQLHAGYIPNLNGNWSLGSSLDPAQTSDGLYANVVPNRDLEKIPKCNETEQTNTDFDSDDFKRYRISDECDSGARVSETFREWHQVTEVPSYNGETLRILPYVIID